MVSKGKVFKDKKGCDIMIDFDSYKQNDRMYGGTAGRKIGICYEGKNYILKYPGNLRDQHLKNINLSYSNSPICEYIGSQIYKILEIPVHNTILGTRNGKVVVACEDFLEIGDKLYEFDKIKVTFEPHFLDSNGSETNGTGVDLYEIIMTMEQHPFLKDIPNLQERFWDMFVVDALIGNGDRNNTNWGIIVKNSGDKILAPVYDNGNCLNSKWDDEKMREILDSVQRVEGEAYKARRCIFELESKRINPYNYIMDMSNEKCNEALIRVSIVLRKKIKKIEEMIDETPTISDVKKSFFKTMIRERFEKVIEPTANRLKEKEMNIYYKQGRSR